MFFPETEGTSFTAIKTRKNYCFIYSELIGMQIMLDNNDTARHDYVVHYP